MRIRLIPLLLLVLLSSAAQFSRADGSAPAAAQAETAATSRAEARRQAIARARERAAEEWKKIEAREQAGIDAANEYMDGVREDNADAIGEGQDSVEQYADNNTVEGYPDTEVRVQEEWVWDPELDDYRLEWQYRLVYKDSLGNAQYEAYFDQNGNVTTPLRESPWRIANQRVRTALGDDNDGPFQVAWGFSEDNMGREYPDTVIVQQGGRINRVQMKFNEFGEPYFWDIRDEDGERQRYGHGLQKPQFTDDGPPLEKVEFERPATGPCEECRELLEARNDLLAEMVPLANRINELAGSHARLNQFAQDEQAHVQDFDRIREEHATKLARYRRLEARFDQADAAWRACEEACIKAGQEAADALAFFSATPSPLLVNVVQDSGEICHFGDLNGPTTSTASPVNNGPVGQAQSGQGGSNGGSPAQTSSGASNGGSTASNGGGQSPQQAGGGTAVTTAPGAQTTSGQSGQQQGQQTSTPSGAGTTGAPGQTGGGKDGSGNPVQGPGGSSLAGGNTGTKGGNSGKGIPVPPAGPGQQDEEQTANPPQDPPTTKQPTFEQVVVIKASAAVLAAGANISGQSAQLVALQPAAVATAPLPSDDCGSGGCDWWKSDDACGQEWFCDEQTVEDTGDFCLGAQCDDSQLAEVCDGGECDEPDYGDCGDYSCAPYWQSDCSGSDCGFVINDPTCTGDGCAPTTCTGNACGWDIGFDQDPVKCALDATGSCSLTVDPVQQAAGDYFIVVDGFTSGLDEQGTYTLDIDVVDSEGITAQSDNADLSALPEQYQQYVGDPIVIDGTTWYTLLYPTAMSAEIQAALAAIAGITGIAIDPCWLKWKTPNDPYFVSSGSWNQNYADQWALHRIGFSPEKENPWDLLSGKEEDVVVAVIDTGLDWNHRDLAWRNIWFNREEIADNGKDDDNNGYIDDTIGWDFWEADNRPWDEDGHGTFIAGIIAARSGNGTGIAGINPKARIMPIRALNAFGHTRASYVARALVYAVDNGARVVNLSVGGAGESDVFRAALDYAESRGVLVVAASGNEAQQLDNILPGNHPTVLTVAALDMQDKRAAFSNYGTQVDIAAPGIDVMSLRARFTDTMLGLDSVDYAAGQATIGKDRRYYRAGGTSFASPFVSGVASLILSRNPALDAADLRRILTQSAHDVDDPGWDRLTGYGRLDAMAALRADPDYFVEALISGFTVAQQEGQTVVLVQGTANANRFDSAQVLLGPGESPSRWRRVGELSKVHTDAVLASIPAAALQGGPKKFTVRLIVKHKDGSTREVRFGLDVG